MIAQAKTIAVEPGSELDRLLEEANGAPLILVREGARYRLQAEEASEDIWADYDPERVLRAFEQATGALSHIDREAFIAEMYELRGQDSHGRPSD